MHQFAQSLPFEIKIRYEELFPLIEIVLIIYSYFA